MCGIVGYTGAEEAKGILLQGLYRLEYRGYDSAGIAVLDGEDGMDVVCRVGKVKELDQAVSHRHLPGHTGIGHTRWATHGRPTEENAHPHRDCSGNIAVVHNGIIENYLEVKDHLVRKGHVFVSETDTEVVAHLLEEFYDGDLLQAMRQTVSYLQGSFSLAAVSAQEPGRIVVTRRDSPLVVGSGTDCAVCASDIPALIDVTRDVVYLDDDQFAVLNEDGAIDFYARNGRRIAPKVSHVDWDVDMAERGGYPDFMLKEIHEQPRVVQDTLRGRMRDGRMTLDEFRLTSEQIASIDRIYIVACGSSYHAGLIAKALIEKWARIPVDIRVASEFRYTEPIITRQTLVIAITQSGETADTLAAMRLARGRGSKVLTVTNVVGSRASRESDGVIYTKAGVEISVAATKSFIAQVTALSCLAMFLGQERGELSADEVATLYAGISETPGQIERILADDVSIRRAAEACVNASSALFIGRSVGSTVCYEGALKLKEISYLHAEAYAAGEIKHGPIALVDEHVPIVALACKSRTYAQVVSNIQELRARTPSSIIAVATEGDTQIALHADYVIYIPEVEECFLPITATVVLQVFARHVAVMRGCDVDHPRNLAKSVTVE